MRYFYLIFFLFFPAVLFAYLDPGTGSLLLYALVGIGTSLWFLLKGFFYQLYSLLLTRNTAKGKAEYGIVFYSEGTTYWQVFYPVISYLLSRKITCTYVTSQKDDVAFSLHDNNFTVICPGSEMFTLAFMNRLCAKIVVSTTPHLDIYMWKRSKKVSTYIHIFHSPTSIDFYEKYALSFYDIIFSVGICTQKAQTYLDKIRALPQKTYYNIGCTYYDTMHAELKSLHRTRTEKTVLYAPTWGLKRSSFFTNGVAIMHSLLKAGFTVIFRPHPQFFVSHKKELDEFVQKNKNQNRLLIDSSPSPLQSMFDSDVLISDFSGIVFDFVYLFERPVLLTVPPQSKAGYEAEELPYDVQWDIPSSKKIAHTLTQEETEHIAEYVFAVLKQTQEHRINIQDFKKNNIFNFCSAAQAAGKALEDIYKLLETSI